MALPWGPTKAVDQAFATMPSYSGVIHRCTCPRFVAAGNRCNRSDFHHGRLLAVSKPLKIAVSAFAHRDSRPAHIGYSVSEHARARSPARVSTRCPRRRTPRANMTCHSQPSSESARATDGSDAGGPLGLQLVIARVIQVLARMTNGGLVRSPSNAEPSILSKSR